MLDPRFLIGWLIEVYSWILVIRCVLSWVRVDHYNPVVRLIYQLTDPVLKPFQSLTLRAGAGGIDFSPIIVFMILRVIRQLLF